MVNLVLAISFHLSHILNCDCSPLSMQAREGYAHLVLELAGVERHLLQAKARVLAEEERALAERNQTSYGYGDVGIPTGKSMNHMYVCYEPYLNAHLKALGELSQWTCQQLYVPILIYFVCSRTNQKHLYGQKT